MLFVWFPVRVSGVPGCNLGLVCNPTLSGVWMLHEDVLQEICVTLCSGSIAEGLWIQCCWANCSASHSKCTWSTASNWE